MESLYITTLAVLIAVDLHLINHPHLSHKLHLACSSSCGSRCNAPSEALDLMWIWVEPFGN